MHRMGFYQSWYDLWFLGGPDKAPWIPAASAQLKFLAQCNFT